METPQPQCFRRLTKLIGYKADIIDLFASKFSCVYFVTSLVVLVTQFGQKLFIVIDSQCICNVVLIKARRSLMFNLNKPKISLKLAANYIIALMMAGGKIFHFLCVFKYNDT